MKKIVALVLAMVMVLGLATTAFGAITLWSPNGETVNCDLYDGAYNMKYEECVQVTFHPATELKVNKAGVVVQPGKIAHYTIATSSDLYVLVDGVPADVPSAVAAANYVLVKKYNPDVPMNTYAFSQSSPDAYYILKKVDAVTYSGVATAFTAWSDACELYADPEAYYGEDLVPYVTVTKGINSSIAFADFGGFIAKVPVADVTVEVATGIDNVLVGGEVVTLDMDVDNWVFATPHVWNASKWAANGVATEYTCVNCKTVGTVINSSLNAPAGAKIDNLEPNGILIAYFYTAPTAGGSSAGADGSTVESAKTFDAGIAMYVGMSVMAAAGSAVVLKKKD